MSRESGDVSDLTVESWKEGLPELVAGYKDEDIWNLDETGCFWKAFSEKVFAKRNSNAEVGNIVNNGLL